MTLSGVFTSHTSLSLSAYSNTSSECSTSQVNFRAEHLSQRYLQFDRV